MKRKLINRAHPIAGSVALAVISVFWISTVVSKLLHDHAVILAVKTGILCGMALLIPALIAVAATGARLGGASRHPIIVRKRRRMPFVAANGILILIPCAVVLQMWASDHAFTSTYDTIQAIELLAGAINMVLLGLSMRDGLRLRGKA